MGLVLLCSALWVPSICPGRQAAGDTIRCSHRRRFLCQTGGDDIWEHAGEPPVATDPLSGCQRCELWLTLQTVFSGGFCCHLLHPELFRTCCPLAAEVKVGQGLAGCEPTASGQVLGLQQPGVGAPGREGAPE